MKHTWKRVLSMVMAIAMIMTMVPSVVFADETDTSATTTDYYLIGYINGADYGCNADWENLGSYKFVDGKLTATFTKESYVFLKTGDNANWYMTAEYCSNIQGTFKNTTTGTTEKMYVPGGVELVFSLTENADGSLTLSYAPIVAGSAGLCGSEWTPSDTTNRMALNDAGMYEITYTNVAEGSYEFKITNGSWSGSWPGSNYSLNVSDVSNVTITFNPSTNEVSVATEVVTGTVSNPKVVETSELNYLTEDLIAYTDDEGTYYEYYYQWTAPEAGTATFSISGTNGSDYLLIVGDEETTDSLSIDVAAGEVVSICAYADNNSETPYLYASGSFASGSADWPISPDWSWNAAQTEASATVTVPAGSTYHFVAYVSGMELTIDGALYGTLNGNRWMPATFTITNDGEAEAEYALKLSYPVGSMYNPDALVIGDNTAAVADTQGYSYTWTAEAAGALTITMTGNNWTYVINTDTSYGDTHYSDEETPISSETVFVSAGDVVTINVGTADWTAADVPFTASFAGDSAENPIFVDFAWNAEYTEATAAVTVPVGTVYFGQYRIGGMVLTINDSESILLENTGSFATSTFSITNDGETPAEYALKLTYPEGSSQHPAQLVIGDNTAVVGTDGQGYNYTWTAEAAGALTITMTGDNWTYVINTASSYGDTHYSDEETPVSSETVLVSAGDVITINVGTADWAAADVPFTASFAGDSAENPIFVDFVWNVEYTEATATVTVPVGTVYFGQYRIGGMVLSINGGEGVILENTGFYYPSTFSITNDGETAAEYTLKLTYAQGTSQNPVQLVIGDNTAAVGDDGQGYNYTWTAEAAGALTITMTGDNWTYVVNTNSSYGTIHYSNDTAPVSSETILVSAGDVVTINVGTADWSVADVPFTASFAGDSAENPIFVDFVWNVEYTEATATVTVPVGTVYFGQYRIGGMVLSINGGEGVVLENTGFFATSTFSITNDGETAAEYTLKLTYAEGTSQNPAQLVIGANTAVVGTDGQGYNYTWTAEEDGALTITMTGDNWTYVINTASSYGDTHYSDEETPVSSETVLVSAGDVITINVGTADWSAAEVPFTASFGTVTKKGNTLSLEGLIYINHYVLFNGFDASVDEAYIEANGGLLVWNTAISEDEAVYGQTDADVNEGLINSANGYMGRTDGIAVAEYADELYMRAYLKLPNGTYVYGPLNEYSVQAYCEGRLEKSANEDLKNVCAALLHFGAAAQVYFNYNANDLANANIAATWPAAEFDASMLTDVDAVNTGIAASESITTVGKSLSLEGAILVNYYFRPGFTPASAELLFWEDVEGELTESNVSYTAELKYTDSYNGCYHAQSKNIASTKYDTTIFCCAKFVDENGDAHYSEVIAYSPEAYAAGRIANSSNANLVAMVKQMVIYGEYAKVYFN